MEFAHLLVIMLALVVPTSSNQHLAGLRITQRGLAFVNDYLVKLMSTQLTTIPIGIFGQFSNVVLSNFSVDVTSPSDLVLARTTGLLDWQLPLVSFIFDGVFYMVIDIGFIMTIGPINVNFNIMDADLEVPLNTEVTSDGKLQFLIMDSPTVTIGSFVPTYIPDDDIIDFSSGAVETMVGLLVTQAVNDIVNTYLLPLQKDVEFSSILSFNYGLLGRAVTTDTYFETMHDAQIYCKTKKRDTIYSGSSIDSSDAPATDRMFVIYLDALLFLTLSEALIRCDVFVDPIRYSPENACLEAVFSIVSTSFSTAVKAVPNVWYMKLYPQSILANIDPAEPYVQLGFSMDIKVFTGTPDSANVHHFTLESSVTLYMELSVTETGFQFIYAKEKTTVSTTRPIDMAGVYSGGKDAGGLANYLNGPVITPFFANYFGPLFVDIGMKFTLPLPKGLVLIDPIVEYKLNYVKITVDIGAA